MIKYENLVRKLTRLKYVKYTEYVTIVARRKTTCQYKNNIQISQCNIQLIYRVEPSNQ